MAAGGGGRGGRGGEVGSGAAGAGDGGAIVMIGCGAYVLAFAIAIRFSARLRHTTVSTTNRQTMATTGGIMAAASTPPDLGFPAVCEELIVRSEEGRRTG